MTARTAIASALSKSSIQGAIALGLTVVVSVGFLQGRIPAEALLVQYAGVIGWLFGVKNGNGTA